MHGAYHRHLVTTDAMRPDPQSGHGLRRHGLSLFISLVSSFAAAAGHVLTGGGGGHRRLQVQRRGAAGEPARAHHLRGPCVCLCACARVRVVRSAPAAPGPPAHYFTYFTYFNYFTYFTYCTRPAPPPSRVGSLSTARRLPPESCA
eukprot:COSAG01_NODE_5091_length_4492_cov_3.461311_3_plen_146_part_00